MSQKTDKLMTVLEQYISERLVTTPHKDLLLTVLSKAFEEVKQENNIKQYSLEDLLSNYAKTITIFESIVSPVRELNYKLFTKNEYSVPHLESIVTKSYVLIETANETLRMIRTREK